MCEFQSKKCHFCVSPGLPPTTLIFKRIGRRRGLESETKNEKKHFLAPQLNLKGNKRKRLRPGSRAEREVGLADSTFNFVKHLILEKLQLVI